MPRFGPEQQSMKRAIRAFFRFVSLAEPLVLEAWQAHGLTLTQVRCLAVLRHEPKVAGEVARHLGIGAASLTRVLDRLESRGLVVRTHDRGDRRRTWVAITDNGRSLIGGLEFWSQSPVFDAIAAMEEGERTQLTEVLDRFSERVRQVVDDERSEGAPAGE